MSPALIDAIVAGPSVGLAILLWIYVSDRKAHAEERKEAHKEAQRLQERNDDIADKAITALTEVNIYLADTARHLENVGGVVTSQHKETREHVVEAIKEIAESVKS